MADGATCKATAGAETDELSGIMSGCLEENSACKDDRANDPVRKICIKTEPVSGDAC